MSNVQLVDYASSLPKTDDDDDDDYQFLRLMLMIIDHI